MMDFSPLPWREGGESSEPGEGFLRTGPPPKSQIVNQKSPMLSGARRHHHRRRQSRRPSGRPNWRKCRLRHRKRHLHHRPRRSLSRGRRSRRRRWIHGTPRKPRTRHPGWKLRARHRGRLPRRSDCAIRRRWKRFRGTHPLSPAPDSVPPRLCPERRARVPEFRQENHGGSATSLPWLDRPPSKR